MTPLVSRTRSRSQFFIPSLFTDEPKAYRWHSVIYGWYFSYNIHAVLTHYMGMGSVSISRFGRTIITQTLIQTISSIYIFNSSIPWFIRQTYLYYQVIYLDLSWQGFDTTMDFDVYVTSVVFHSYLYTWYLYWFDGSLQFEFNLVDVCARNSIWVVVSVCTLLWT